eukprot:696068-Hanusia_phi.AAC.1
MYPPLHACTCSASASQVSSPPPTSAVYRRLGLRDLNETRHLNEQEEFKRRRRRRRRSRRSRRRSRRGMLPSAFFR